MSKSNSHETALLQLEFNATAYADIAENDTTSPLTAFYVSIHAGSPGEGGNQTTNEAAHTGYAREPVNRNSGGWTVTGNAVENTGIVQYDECTAGTTSATHFGIGTDVSGAGRLTRYGALGATIEISAGITPNFPAGAIDVTED